MGGGIDIYYYPNELYHHGIKGQRWGERNGPPYPLDAEDHSSSERKAGKSGWTREAKQESSSVNRQKSNDDTNQNEQNDKRRGLTDKQKKYLKVGAAVVGTALVAYGGYKLYQAYNDKGAKFDSLTGFRLLDKDMTTEQHLNAINPGRVRFLSTKYKNVEIIDGSSYNCMLCTTAYDLRMRGYDVRAGYSNDGYTNDLFTQIYKDYKGVTKCRLLNSGISDRGVKINMDHLTEALMKTGDSGARGNIMVYWKTGGGHSMIWERVGDTIKFMDAQTGEVYKDFGKEILTHVHTSAPIEFLRTDNLEINPEGLKKVMNTDNAVKTYIDHGAEIVSKFATDPAVVPVEKLALEIGASSAMYSTVRRSTINKYRKEHPNTKLTDKEILKVVYGV